MPIQLTNVQDSTPLVFLALQNERTTKNTFLYVIDNLSNTFVPFMIKVLNISINFIRITKSSFFELYLILCGFRLSFPRNGNINWMAHI